MVSYLRSSDCTIIYEFPHVVSHRVRQVDDMLSVLTKDVELNVQERQVDGQVRRFRSFIVESNESGRSTS